MLLFWVTSPRVLAFLFASGSKSSDHASLLSVQLWIARPNLFFVLFFIDDEAVFTQGAVKQFPGLFLKRKLSICTSNCDAFAGRSSAISVVMPAEIRKNQTCIWISVLTFLAPIVKALHRFLNPRLFHWWNRRRESQIHVDANHKWHTTRILLKSVLVVLFNFGRRGLVFHHAPLF